MKTYINGTISSSFTAAGIPNVVVSEYALFDGTLSFNRPCNASLHAFMYYTLEYVKSSDIQNDIQPQIPQAHQIVFNDVFRDLDFTTEDNLVAFVADKLGVTIIK